MTTEYDTYDTDIIVDKPSNNKDYEEIPSSTGEVIIEKNSPVRNNTRRHRSSESRNRQEYQPSIEGKC